MPRTTLPLWDVTMEGGQQFRIYARSAERAMEEASRRLVKRGWIGKHTVAKEAVRAGDDPLLLVRTAGVAGAGASPRAAAPGGDRPAA